MKRRAVWMLVTGLLLVAIVATTQAAAPPRYLLLQVDAAPIPRPNAGHQGLGSNNGQPAQPYAYGWFGASSRQHWSRHFGYYRNYTQWSGK